MSQKKSAQTAKQLEMPVHSGTEPATHFDAEGETANPGAESQYTVRRRVPRRPIDKRIGLLVAGKYHIAHAFEIGEGGMLITSNSELRVEQKVVLTVRIPGVLQGVMLGKVLYRIEPKKSDEKVRYGIQFEQVDFEIKRRIRNFVASSEGPQSA